MEADGDFHADGDVIAYSTSVSDRRFKKQILLRLKPKGVVRKTSFITRI